MTSDLGGDLLLMPPQPGPREAQDSPSEALELVVSESVSFEGLTIHVPGVSVALDCESLLGIGKVRVNNSVI
jgi:hypothetical protein